MTAVEEVWRREAPGVVAALARRYGGFDDCEDATQLALIAAAEQWPRDGVPDDPRAWLLRVASRRLVDQWRSDDARRRREEREWIQAVHPPSASSTDDSLQLMVLCCHPALTPASQVALMLRSVSGLTTAEVAAGFGVPETTMGQRISRAKSTLRRADMTFPQATPAEVVERSLPIRHAIALLFSEGHMRTSGATVTDHVLTTEALRLARLVHALLPRDPENAGLLALLLLTHARAAARTDERGELVPLEKQDRTQWDRALIREGIILVDGALPIGPVGQFQLQAAIAAVHADAASSGDTDWPQIRELYRMLTAVAPSQATRLGLATATAEVSGSAAGLALLDQEPAKDNHRWWAVRGHLLLRLDRHVEARVALATAARSTRSIPEQRYLNGLLASLLRAARPSSP